MARKDIIQVNGRVLECFPNATFRVELSNGHCVLAHVAGKKHLDLIRVLPGDQVVLEMNPYDLTKGRITPP